MGHYDNCREGNCPVCGQLEGHCEHSGESVDYEVTPTRREIVEAALDVEDPSSLCGLCGNPVFDISEWQIVPAHGMVHLCHEECVAGLFSDGDTSA